MDMLGLPYAVTPTDSRKQNAAAISAAAASDPHYDLAMLDALSPERRRALLVEPARVGGQDHDH